MFRFIENVARIGAESTEVNGDIFINSINAVFNRMDRISLLNRYEHFFKHCIILYLVKHLLFSNIYSYFFFI
jgi:hypothetical protein